MILPPLPPGVTTVDAVRLYTDEARTQGVQSPPVALESGRWVVDTLNVPDGRWWGRVEAHKGATPYTYPLSDPVDLPEDDSMVISPEELADEIDMPLPLTAKQRRTLRSAIRDAQSDVYAYLGQPVMPTQFVQTGVFPYGTGWELSAHGDASGAVRVLSAVAEEDPLGGQADTFTVTYLAGMNARDDVTYEPIRRYIMAHAMNSPDVVRLWRDVVKPTKTIKSSSTQGQSVSYEVPTLGGGGAAGSDSPGALPSRDTMSRWRVAGLRVHQGRSRYGDPEWLVR